MNGSKIVRMSACALLAAQSLSLCAGTFTWSGGGAAGDWNDAANWGGAGVPTAGDTAAFASSADVTADFSVGSGSDALVISAASGATVEFTGAISGSAPIALDGAGAIGFGGANTFTGNLTVGVATFNARSDGAFGTTDGTTAFNAGGGSPKWYFHGITTAEAIVIDNAGGANTLQFPAGTTNVFNGAWSRKQEQYRAVVGTKAAVRFNADFANDIHYMTFTLSAGSLLDFNATFTGTGGAPRFCGSGTVIYRKSLTLAAISTYGFFYQHAGIQKLLAENVFGTGSSAAALTTHNSDGYTVTLDLQGHDQDCAALFGKTTNLTTPEGSPATLHVYNCVAQPEKYANGGTFAGKVTGPVSIAVEGNSKLEALTLCTASESTGTLIARNGGRAVFTGDGKWGTGGATIGAGSSVAVVNSGTFGSESALTVATGGAIDLAEGTVQTVKTLRLGDVTGENGKTYGALDTTETVDVKSACITGKGVIRVVIGKTYAWKGPAEGLWSNASNWEPSGVPADGDQLVFDASDAAVSAVNDIAGLTLAKITLSGTKAIALSGEKAVIADRGEISAAGCTGGIACALPLESAGSDGFTIRSTAASSWNFTGAWSGSAPIRFDGDHTGVYAFRQDSPAFTGNLFLSNAGRYDLWNAGALGTTAGYTRYEVRQGDYSSNGGKTLEPFCFHGIDTSENFLLAGFSSFSLIFPEGTTNVLRGSLDTPSDRYVTSLPDVERIQVGANARLTVTGSVAKKSLSGCGLFEIILFHGDAGSTVVLDSEWGETNIRAYPSAGAVFVQNVPQTKVKSVGLFDAGTYRFGCDNALGADGATQFILGYNKTGAVSAIDLAGHAVVLDDLVCYTSAAQYGYVRFVDSAGNGTLTYTGADGFACRLGASVAVTVRGAGTRAFDPISCDDGVRLSVEGGAAVTTGSAVPLAALAVDGSSSYALTAGGSLAQATAVTVASGGTIALADAIDQPVASLTLGGKAQPGGYSYGSSASAADFKSAFFTGKGLMRIPGVVDATVRTWKGAAGGTWSEPGNWEPAGAIGYGNVLVFDATQAAVASENDVDLVRISSIRLKGGNAIDLSGKTCGILAGGTVSGDAASCATVTFGLPLDLIHDSDAAVSLNASSGQVFRVVGAVSGGADLTLGGGGAVELRGDNAFTGVLTYTNGVLDVYADGAFGTTDGKTVIRIPDAVPAGCRAPFVTFHGVTTGDEIAWYQTYGAMAGSFAAGTTNVFNGAFRGTGGQPRWWFGKNAMLVVNGKMSDCRVFTVNTDSGAVYEQRGAYDSQSFRMQGKGTFRLFNDCTLEMFDYTLLHMADAGSRPTLTFEIDNALHAKDKKLAYYPLAVAAGLADLNGHAQSVASLCGGSNAVITNSGDKVELRAMMTYDGTYYMDGGSGAKFPISRFDGAIGGAIDFTAEGTGMPTQYLGGVSAPAGILTVKNGATVCLDGTGRWGGEVDVRDASTLVFRDQANFGKSTTLRLAATGRVHLDANVRCRNLYLNGTLQPSGVYGASRDAAHFSGAGVLRVMGHGLIIVVK